MGDLTVFACLLVKLILLGLNRQALLPLPTYTFTNSYSTDLFAIDAQFVYSLLFVSNVLVLTCTETTVGCGQLGAQGGGEERGWAPTSHRQLG